MNKCPGDIFGTTEPLSFVIKLGMVSTTMGQSAMQKDLFAVNKVKVTEGLALVLLNMTCFFSFFF